MSSKNTFTTGLLYALAAAYSLSNGEATTENVQGIGMKFIGGTTRIIAHQQANGEMKKNLRYKGKNGDAFPAIRQDRRRMKDSKSGKKSKKSKSTKSTKSYKTKSSDANHLYPTKKEQEENYLNGYSQGDKPESTQGGSQGNSEGNADNKNEENPAFNKAQFGGQYSAQENNQEGAEPLRPRPYSSTIDSDSDIPGQNSERKNRSKARTPAIIAGIVFMAGLAYAAFSLGWIKLCKTKVASSQGQESSKVAASTKIVDAKDVIANPVKPTAPPAPDFAKDDLPVAVAVPVNNK